MERYAAITKTFKRFSAERICYLEQVTHLVCLRDSNKLCKSIFGMMTPLEICLLLLIRGHFRTSDENSILGYEPGIFAIYFCSFVEARTVYLQFYWKIYSLERC